MDAHAANLGGARPAGGVRPFPSPFAGPSRCSRSLQHPAPTMGQSMSFGLTQYDVEELIAYTKGACES